MRTSLVALLLVSATVASAAPAMPDRDQRAIAAVTPHLEGDWKVSVSPVPLSGNPAARITSKLVRVEAVKQGTRFGHKVVDDHFVIFDESGARWAGKESQGLLVQAGKRTPAHELIGMLRDTNKLGAVTNTLLMSGLAGASSTYLDISVNHAALPEWLKMAAVTVVASQRLWHVWSDARKIQTASRAAAMATTINELKTNDPLDAWSTYLNVMRRDHDGTSPYGLGCFYDQLAMRGL